MSLGLLDIDGETGKAILYNCGNPFPYLLRSNGTVEEIQGFGRLIGYGMTSTVTPVTVELEPGERLLFYSDGLVEPLAELFPDAYAAFQEYVATLTGTSSTELPGELIARHPYLAHGGSFPDDATVVVVERLPAPPCKVGIGDQLRDGSSSIVHRIHQGARNAAEMRISNEH